MSNAVVVLSVVVSSLTIIGTVGGGVVTIVRAFSKLEQRIAVLETAFKEFRRTQRRPTGEFRGS